MTIYRYPEPREHTPLVLLVPSSPPDDRHWMSAWTRRSEHCRILELGLWDEPHRNTWVNRLNLAIRRADRPVVVVTEGIAALALAWWVEFEGIGLESPVIGAIVADPPNVDMPGSDPRLSRFGACPRSVLPFSTFLASDLRGSAAHQRSLMRLARDWGACPVFEDADGEWDSGWRLLRTIVGLLPAAPRPPASETGSGPPAAGNAWSG